MRTGIVDCVEVIGDGLQQLVGEAGRQPALHTVDGELAGLFDVFFELGCERQNPQTALVVPVLLADRPR